MLSNEEKRERKVNYLLRNISWPLWQKVKQEALNQDTSVRALIIDLLEKKHGQKDNRKDR